jgi:hypothetical protein
MGHRRGTTARLAALTVATLIAFGGASAASAFGDTYYVSETKKTFVSFAVTPNGSEVTDLGYRAAKLKCSNGQVQKKGMVSFGRTVPVQESPTGQPFFEAFWAAGAPSFGGIAGELKADRVDGFVDVRIKRRKKVVCESGNRRWTAEPVTEEAWLAARERAGIPEVELP